MWFDWVGAGPWGFGFGDGLDNNFLKLIFTQVRLRYFGGSVLEIHFPQNNKKVICTTYLFDFEIYFLNSESPESLALTLSD